MRQSSIYLRVLWLNDNEDVRPSNLNIELTEEIVEPTIFSISKNDSNIGLNAPWEADEWANGITYNWEQKLQETPDNEDLDDIETPIVSNIPYVIPIIVDNDDTANYRKNIIKDAETEDYAYYTIKMTYISPKPRKMKARTVVTPSVKFNGINVENATFNGMPLNKMVFNGNVVFEKKQASGSFLDLVLQNTTLNEGNPDFSLTATTDEGLWTMEDDYGTSYYFRGAVENNYVKFAGFWWRIIRINGDGTVRMIYDGKVSTAPNGYANGTKNANRTAKANVSWNSNQNDAKYVGYMYGGENGTASTKRIADPDSTEYADPNNAVYNQTDSNMKTVLEQWYVDNLSDYDDYIADEIFCNDRSISDTPKEWWASESTTNRGFGQNATAYGAFSRFKTKSNGWNTTPNPKLTCKEKNDAFTKNDTEKGNGKLNQKVGLITADEINLAGSGKGGTANSNYYLYKGNWYWAFSSNIYNSLAYVFYVNSSGGMDAYDVPHPGRLSPVINLTTEYANRLQGQGTTSNPYAVVE